MCFFVKICKISGILAERSLEHSATLVLSKTTTGKVFDGRKATNTVLLLGLVQSTPTDFANLSAREEKDFPHRAVPGG